ncbi:dihydrolipoyl dehydrogenase [bacterium (Candidatus Blackallbacteria) CG17_big_fil_post_rev_8_21_14_2_50_48_46]|uniref:Dihydrolipoyl dehydrogenase n=1 Tax=bacterium (Candidatus Blackallbacteria) CG17_big_fil_post_rev_8_21_14_2_50_48_46 TaxID=2014261 RepID=A0A2M7GBC3_9BACT|nr:MAG: dihydrolipoyl dehydrogenase [bacterium (Candidatus Blackallbacteria) CG18_big_fil_WC_8_21_14_2_50_49_26]PIW19458.1 MAG: dihydrolipoyl dehydrogenase [bacterium (Candidatus Blackallbacteria) CG17_big_fil_post_rev_8_21_14_2_50_48_46]PIW48938.1 MAG: dihydrolipoyl dehydrogenase [bacterium (Candidatus Blackallbacteria) CG13_big_fil_rev_8_21_14_2_50_49_14]
MQVRHVDVAVIGGGTAGLAAWREATQAGAEALLIEGGPYGTTCARVGCMPSKLLIAAAEAARAVRKAPAFGIQSSLPQIDGKAVMARVRSERDRFVGFVLEGVEAIPAELRIQGYARFLSPTRLQVGDDLQIEAQAIVIATGSSPWVPPLLQNLGNRLIDNEALFNWEDLPESVAVFGAGVVGLELGQALHQLGVRVHLFGVRGAVGALTDPEIKAEAQALFAAEFPFQTDARVERVERSETGVRISYLNTQDETISESFDYVLAATGRWPNLSRLGIEVLGLPLNRLGLPEFDPHTLQIGRLPIFLAGDVNNDRPLLHEAVDEGRIAGANAAHWPQLQAGQRRSPLSVIFTHPQIAMIGQNYSQLDLACSAIGEVSFKRQGRSRVMLENEGRLRIYADHRSRRLLGAEMIGPRAEHLAHLLAWAHQQQLTIDQLLEMPFYHPVIEEGVRTALQETQKALNLGPARGKCDCGLPEPELMLG